MRRNEVLEHRQSLLEVRQNRVLDDLTALGSRLLGLGHQASHTRKLTNLLLRTAGSRVQHHVYRVEPLLVVGQVIEHRLGQLHVDIRPDVDDLVVTLVVRDQTHVIALHHLLDALVALVDERLFLLGDNHRVEVERQAALECHPVAECLDVVQKLAKCVPRRTSSSPDR